MFNSILDQFDAENEARGLEPALRAGMKSTPEVFAFAKEYIYFKYDALCQYAEVEQNKYIQMAYTDPNYVNTHKEVKLTAPIPTVAEVLANPPKLKGK